MKDAVKLFDQDNLPEPNVFPLNQMMNYLTDSLKITFEMLWNYQNS